jgi:hypothetical protein
VSRIRPRRAGLWMLGTLALMSSLGAAALRAAGTSSSPATAASSSPAPKASQRPLREIGHVKARTAYCTAFEEYFNGSTQPILSGDSTLGVVRLSLDDLNKSFTSIDGTSQRYDIRLRLMHDVDELQSTLGPAQDAVNHLRTSAALSQDPVRAKQTRELAKDLQRALDRHKAMATDLLGVIHALAEYEQSHAYDPAPLAGGYDPNVQNLPIVGRDVKEYLKFDQVVDRTKDAESSAADLADTIVQSC